MAVKQFDFSGYATKNDLVCADGRTIRKDAFKQNDGTKVPLVWQHGHDNPNNVLGHAILENRDDGVYAYCILNDTQSGKQARVLVEHGDIVAMSIYANKLIEKSKVVHAGNIREVSLVLSGANPGALIDNVVVVHGDDDDESEDGVVIYTGLELSLKHEEEIIEHADPPQEDNADEETVGDVFDTLTPKQKDVVYALIAQAAASNTAKEVSQADTEGETFMKQNVFEKPEVETRRNVPYRPRLTSAQIRTIVDDGIRMGSFKQSFLAHAEDYGVNVEELKHVDPYGIGNIDYLFPDARAVTPTPTFIQREMAWVSTWMNGTKHTPFSRIKSLSADITVETARALGYIKGNMKKEEYFELAKRVTTPTTIYKKQKLDRDDIIDITDFDVVVWLKAEMRMMLDEEVARAGLLGDGRDPGSEDKISETNIRPVYKDATLYAFRVPVAASATVMDIMDEIVRARKDYKGVGNPTMFTTTDFLTDMLLQRDTLNHRLYPTMNDVQSALRVSNIVEVPVMEGQTYVDTSPTPDVTYNCLAIILNPSDYTYGADKGGAVSMFDDFDIDFNQQKYLIETRLSGALVNPKTAFIVEQATV